MEHRDDTTLAFYGAVCKKNRILTALTYSYFCPEAYEDYEHE